MTIQPSPAHAAASTKAPDPAPGPAPGPAPDSATDSATDSAAHTATDTATDTASADAAATRSAVGEAHPGPDALSQPLHPGAPCGEDLAFCGAFDAIARAREHDDPALAQGAWVAPLKLADWPAVARLTQELLLTRSKDLRLAAWWAESQASLRGWRGLADGLDLAAALVRLHWDQLHPRATGHDQELRIGALAWLLKRTAALAGTLASPAAAFEPMQHDAASGRAQGPASWPALLADHHAACIALTLLEQAVDPRLGADGPAFRPAHEALEQAGHALRRRAQEAGWQGGAAAEAQKVPAAAIASPGPYAAAPARTAASATHAAPALGDASIRDREDAVRRLRDIAAWFHRAEPHSPAGYLADKAADWAGMPLHAWLRLVLKQGRAGQEGTALSHVEELLGLGPATACPVD